jgi:hypothetical protein
MDSIATYRVNFHVTGDTVWSSSLLYSNPSIYYLTLNSTTYTVNTGTELVPGYDYKGISPDMAGYAHGVWKLTGDTTYFPLTNKPLNQGGTVYYSIENSTTHSLLLTTRAFHSQLGVNMTSFNKFYYHK